MGSKEPRLNPGYWLILVGWPLPLVYIAPAGAKEPMDPFEKAPMITEPSEGHPSVFRGSTGSPGPSGP